LKIKLNSKFGVLFLFIFLFLSFIALAQPYKNIQQIIKSGYSPPSYKNIQMILGREQALNIQDVRHIKSFQPTEFIQVSGTNLTLGGKPYRFVGMNSYYLVDYATNFTYDDDGNPIYNSRKYVLEVLNEMHYLNLNVLRTWGGMECGSLKGYSVWDCNNSGGHYNAFQKYSPGNWSEEMFEALDWLIYEAGKRDIRVALVLVNNWKEYGGMRWYVQQSPTTNKTWENITDDTDSRFWEFHDQFYSDVNCKQYFKNFISYLLNRNNTYTGRYYKDDPTIAMWVLTNEARAKSQGSNYTLISNWAKEMSDFIRSIDQNHIIALGIEGWGTPWEGTNFIYNQNLGNLSIATYNINPYQWDWFAQRSEYATNLDWADEGWNTSKVIDWWTNNTSLSYNNRYEIAYTPNYNPNLGRHGYKDWVRQHVDWANVNLSKPVMAMEVLYPLRKGKVAVDGDKATYDLRVRFFNQTVKNFFDNGGDGLLFWVLQHDDYYWSTANSSYPGKMDDGFGFYVSNNPILRDSSKPVIDVLSWIRDSGYVNLLNDYQYNFYFKPNIVGANPKNASIYLFINNENGTSYTLKITNSSEILNNQLNYFTHQFQRVCDNSDKNFSYIIEVCSDNPSLGCKNTTMSEVITLLTYKPSINLYSPQDDKRFASLTQIFNYSVSADLDITYCELFINGVSKAVNPSVEKDTPQTFTVNFDSEGVYRWKVECSDIQSNLGNSPERTIIIGSPKWSNVQTSVPSTYANIPSIFNITWNDSVGYSITQVLFESNFSGVPTNYTMTLIDPYINATENKGVYNFNLTLPAGTFYWKSYAQASDGIWNSTDSWYLTINKGTPTLNLFIDDVANNKTITWLEIPTIKGNETNYGDSDLSYCLYNDTSLEGCGSPFSISRQLASGTYSWVYNTTGGANWTSGASPRYYLFVNKAWNQTDSIKADEEYYYDFGKLGIPVLTKLIEISPYSFITVDEETKAFYKFIINNTNNDTGLTTTFTNVYANFTPKIDLTIWKNESAMENVWSSLAFNSPQEFLVNVSNITVRKVSWKLDKETTEYWYKYHYYASLEVIENNATPKADIRLIIYKTDITDWNNQNKDLLKFYVDGIKEGINITEYANYIELWINTSHISSSLEQGIHPVDIYYYVPTGYVPLITGNYTPPYALPTPVYLITLDLIPEEQRLELLKNGAIYMNRTVKSGEVLALEPATYFFKFYKEGYKTKSFEAKIEANQTIKVVLEPLSKVEQKPSPIFSIPVVGQFVKFGQEILNKILNFPIIVIVALIILLIYLFLPTKE
jgi:mannan endo-1,4-beta-mannosidase